VWQGVLGPDLGAKDATEAANEIQISFNVRVADGVTDVSNTAYIDSDLNGDGDVSDANEQQVANASASWERPASDVKVLPQTGFQPGRISVLPDQPAALRYSQEDLVLEIPSLGIDLPVVGVPQSGDGWDVTWLGQKAGWLNGTAYPTASGNSVITGHVWDAFNQPGPFAQIRKLSTGDWIRIHAYGKVYTYEVRENRLVSPNQARLVFAHEEKAWVTLITCENYNTLLDGYANRRMVRAVLISVAPEK
jgi:LPXTG-site transpeptidase (sortase) family protein